MNRSVHVYSNYATRFIKYICWYGISGQNTSTEHEHEKTDRFVRYICWYGISGQNILITLWYGMWTDRQNKGSLQKKKRFFVTNVTLALTPPPKYDKKPFSFLCLKKTFWQIPKYVILTPTPTHLTPPLNLVKMCF